MSWWPDNNHHMGIQVSHESMYVMLTFTWGIQNCEAVSKKQKKEKRRRKKSSLLMILPLCGAWCSTQPGVAKGGGWSDTPDSPQSDSQKPGTVCSSAGPLSPCCTAAHDAGWLPHTEGACLKHRNKHTQARKLVTGLWWCFFPCISVWQG